jgi:hypothetical protein
VLTFPAAGSPFTALIYAVYGIGLVLYLSKQPQVNSKLCSVSCSACASAFSVAAHALHSSCETRPAH